MLFCPVLRVLPVFIMPYIGTKLRTLRKKTGVSQIDLGKELGISQGTISSYERNQIAPRMNVIHKISDYFQVNAAFLISNDVDNGRTRDGVSTSELELIRKYRRLPEYERQLLVSFLHDMIIACETKKYS